MCCTCGNVQHMVMIQVRDVPDDVHRKLKSQAALEGLSLSEYLKRDLIVRADQPTWAQVRARIRARGPSGLRTETVREALDELREE